MSVALQVGAGVQRESPYDSYHDKAGWGSSDIWGVNPPKKENYNVTITGLVS